MKSAILYPYGTFRGAGCCRMLHAKHLALTSAVYTLVSFNIFIFLNFKIEMHLNSTKKFFLPRKFYYDNHILYIYVFKGKFLYVYIMYMMYRKNCRCSF